LVHALAETLDQPQRAQRFDQVQFTVVEVAGLSRGTEVVLHLKDDAKEVKEGLECGIGIENFNDIKIGDVIECYRKEQVARTLTSTATA